MDGQKRLDALCQCGHTRRKHYLNGSVHTVCLNYRNGRYCRCDQYKEKKDFDLPASA